MKTALKVAITLGAIALAVGLGLLVWRDYLVYPWTRDGQVSSYVVGIAARVHGPMVRVAVQDNQWVERGDLLFEIDPTDYRQAVAAAEATLQKSKAKAENLYREVERRRGLVADELISLEEFQTIQTQYLEAVADIAVAEANLSLSRLDLGYTKVYATVNGYVTNLVVTEGTYVTEGQPLVALVDAESFWVNGYFKETDLKNIKPGDRAEVRLMGHYFEPIKAVVESTGWGIFREDGSEGQNLLPRVQPTVDWVRLAQRFPVRLHLLNPPEDLPLRIGLTASVMVFPGHLEAAPGETLQQAESEYPKILVDGRGTEVIIPALPERILSLAPSTTAIMRHLDAADTLVGVTEHCQLPSRYAGLPRLATYPAIPLERVIELEPDLVLLADITDSTMAQNIRRYGIPVMVLNSAGYDGIIEDILLAGEATNRAERARRLAAELLEAQREARPEAIDWEPPRTVLFLDREGEFAAGAGSFADALIHIAGGENIALKAPGKWPQLSREYLVEADPEVILLAEPAGTGQRLSEAELAGYREASLWSGLSAIRSGRVYKIDQQSLNVPGPEVLRALEQIAAAIQETGPTAKQASSSP